MKTEVLAVELNSGKIAGQKEDLAVWIKEYEALRKWEI